MEQVVQSQVEIQAFLSISSRSFVYFPSVRTRQKEVSKNCSGQNQGRNCFMWAPLRNLGNYENSFMSQKKLFNCVVDYLCIQLEGYATSRNYNICYIRKTPKPCLFPSHVVEDPLRSGLLRDTKASPNPTTSLVSVGLIIPSSHNRAVEYNAVD